jgi:hypothetical protein
MLKAGDALNGSETSGAGACADGSMPACETAVAAAQNYLEQMSLAAGPSAPKFIGFDTQSNAEVATVPTISEPAYPSGASRSDPGGLVSAGPPVRGVMGAHIDAQRASAAGTAASATSGMTINLVFDSNAQSAPQSFRDGMQTAASIIDAAFSDPVTINIEVGFGEFPGGGSISPNVSEGGFAQSISESYPTLRNLLASHETSANDRTSVNSLPNTTTIQGQANVVIGSGLAKALGVLAPSNGALDGIVGMGTNFTGNALIATALHEITHAMARVGGTRASEDLFRFTSAGIRLFNGNIPAPASYFSIDNGVTKLADFGQTSDPSDFLNSAADVPPGNPSSSLTPNDPFDEFITGHTATTLTSIDLEQMDVLGFTLAGNPAPVVPTSPTIVRPTNLDSMKPGDFDHGGTSDAVVFGTDGTLFIYSNSNGAPVSVSTLGQVGSDFTFGGVGNFFGASAASDFILRGPLGQLELYQIQNNQIAGASAMGAVGTDWQIVSVGDYFQSSTDAFVMRNVTSGAMELYHVEGGQLAGASALGAVGTDQQVVGQGNFFNNGTEDLLMEQQGTGALTLYQVKSGQLVGASALGAVGGDEHVVGVGDFNGDGVSDILMQQDNGTLRFYEMQNGQVANVSSIGQIGLNFQPAGVGDFFGNGTDDFMMRSGPTIELYKVQNYQIAGASLYGEIGQDLRFASGYFNHLV